MRFAQSPYRPADTQPKPCPSVRAHLPRSQRARGFQNLDFACADWDGILFENRCWIRVPLPPYPLDRLRGGQFDSVHQRPLWQATLPLRSSRPAAASKQASPP